MTALAKPSPQATVLSLAQLLEQQPPSAPPCLVEPGLLPPQGILFVGGKPKVGKSLLVANLALRTGRKILWDAGALQARGCPEAAPAIRREYRRGW